MSHARFDFADLAPADDRRVRELWGRAPINLYRVLAHQPRLLRAWTEWNNELRHGCALPRDLRELIFLRSAFLHHADYEWEQHLAMARRAGVSEAKIDAIPDWNGSDRFDERERATLLATDHITRGELDDQTFARLRAAFTPAEAIEVIVTAAHSCMLARVIQAIGVTSDGEAPGGPGRDERI